MARGFRSGRRPSAIAGFFHDDEDLLPRPFDANGYLLQTGDVPLDWYKRFFETALRLRMNMVAPYTRVHRRYEVQKLARDWGRCHPIFRLAFGTFQRYKRLFA